MAEETKRVRRSKEEINTEINKKIAYHQKCIDELEAKKLTKSEKRDKIIERLLAEKHVTEEEAKILGYKEAKKVKE